MISEIYIYNFVRNSRKSCEIKGEQPVTRQVNCESLNERNQFQHILPLASLINNNYYALILALHQAAVYIQLIITTVRSTKATNS